MPADLDDMFAQLGEHADSVPLGTAATARQRGTQRTRTRAMVAAALAVCLAGGGAAWLTRPATGQHDPNPPAETKGTGKLAEVGPLLPYGGTPRIAMAAIAGDRVFSGWQDEDGAIKVSAADLRTGEPVWPARSPGRFDEFGGILAFPQAVLVNDGTDTNRTLYVYDPATGKQRWSLPYGVADDLIFENDVLIQMVATTGLTRALDWATGVPRWSVPAGADRPARSLGVHQPRDQERAGQYGLPLSFENDRFVQITKSGVASLRSVRTGDVIEPVGTGVPTGEGLLVAYDRWLYFSEKVPDGGYRISAARLEAPGMPEIIFTSPPRRRLSAMTPCGPQRICLLDTPDNAETTTLTAVATDPGSTLWRVEAPESADTLQSLHGRTLVRGGGDTALFDADGRQVFRTGPGMSGWMGPENVFSAQEQEPGPAIRVSAADGRVTPLGEMPAVSSFCTWTIDRMACPTDTGLRLWDLRG